MAAAQVSGTFAPTLAPRSEVDQGAVTALSTGLHYLLALGTQDALQALAAELAHLPVATRWSDPVARQRVLVLAADLLAVPLGTALQRALPNRPGEAMPRGAARQTGWRTASTGIAALSLEAARSVLRLLDDRLDAGGRVARLPVAVPLGLGIAFALDRRRRVPHDDDGRPNPQPPQLSRSLLVAGGVEGGLAALAYSEHLLASAVGRRLATRFPGGPQVWRLATHAASVGALAAGTSVVWSRAMHSIEEGAAAEESVLGEGDPTRWLTPTMSGGPGSLVPWSTLGKEGARHMVTSVRTEPMTERPAGVPDVDLSIVTVMGTPAVASPVQVFVGLDTAPTPEERVELAMAEMERTGAFDRSLLVLVSPTGLGYVNYVAMAAAQYLTLGDVASVTVQYSNRPSPLSLGRVGRAREQNRLLWLRVLDELRRRPGPRPRVVLFGESLGAHTSQDVFLHSGTLGLEALGIDRALWLGTPYGSGWMHEVTGPPRPDVDPSRIAVVNDIEQLHAVADQRGGTPPYVLLSHDNDGVTRFGVDLLTTAPAWLGPNRPKVEDGPEGASPRGIPAYLRWRPVTSFFQTLVDMKNAMRPATWGAWGHDYRPDLARFISEVYGLPASPEQLARVEAAVRQREEARWELYQED